MAPDGSRQSCIDHERGNIDLDDDRLKVLWEALEVLEEIHPVEVNKDWRGVPTGTVHTTDVYHDHAQAVQAMRILSCYLEEKDFTCLKSND